MTEKQKYYIEDYIDAIDARKWELFFSDRCPEGVGGILYEAGVEFLKEMNCVPAWSFQSSNIQKIDIPHSVTRIDGHAFAYCSSLTSINIPSSVTSIDNYAFEDCSSLTSIVIPDSVESIGSMAFYNCSNLTSVVFEGTRSQWYSIKKGPHWAFGTLCSVVTCTDGNVLRK